jgi:hypothetical protein
MSEYRFTNTTELAFGKQMLRSGQAKSEQKSTQHLHNFLSTRQNFTQLNLNDTASEEQKWMNSGNLCEFLPKKEQVIKKK